MWMKWLSIIASSENLFLKIATDIKCFENWTTMKLFKEQFSWKLENILKLLVCEWKFFSFESLHGKRKIYTSWSNILFCIELKLTSNSAQFANSMRIIMVNGSRSAVARWTFWKYFSKTRQNIKFPFEMWKKKY